MCLSDLRRLALEGECCGGNLLNLCLREKSFSREIGKMNVWGWSRSIEQTCLLALLASANLAPFAKYKFFSRPRKALLSLDDLTS